MSERREPSSGDIRRALREVRRLRREGALTRLGREYGDEEPPPPAGGWKPILDDAGRVIPDPPPDEPTDATEPSAG